MLLQLQWSLLAEKQSIVTVNEACLTLFYRAVIGNPRSDFQDTS